VPALHHARLHHPTRTHLRPHRGHPHLAEQAPRLHRVCEVLGFCIGGDFALLLAPSGGYQAAAINYARVPTDADSLLAGSCPVVASYGTRDRTLRGAAHRLEHALSDAGVPHDVTEYPDAGHAFLNQHPPGELPLLLAPLGLLNRAGYHEPAAGDARARIISFLQTHLQP
jgi:carboxymethylenebutenolidase